MHFFLSRYFESRFLSCQVNDARERDEMINRKNHTHIFLMNKLGVLIKRLENETV